MKVLQARKQADTNFPLSYQSRNMVWEFRKIGLHRPIKILNFLTSARAQKCLTQLQNISAFLATNHLQAGSRTQLGMFVYFIIVITDFIICFQFVLQFHGIMQSHFENGLLHTSSFQLAPIKCFITQDKFAQLPMIQSLKYLVYPASDILELAQNQCPTIRTVHAFIVSQTGGTGAQLHEGHL